MIQTYWRRNTNTTPRKSYHQHESNHWNHHQNDVSSCNALFRYVRTGQLGHGTPRRPEIIDDFGVYKWEIFSKKYLQVGNIYPYNLDTTILPRRVVKSKIGSLIREGPDKRPSAYTPLGPLRRQQSGLIGLHCDHHQSFIGPVRCWQKRLLATFHSVIASHASPLIPTTWVLNRIFSIYFHIPILGPSPSPRPYRRQATFSEPYRWSVIIYGNLHKFFSQIVWGTFLYFMV